MPLPLVHFRVLRGALKAEWCQGPISGDSDSIEPVFRAPQVTPMWSQIGESWGCVFFLFASGPQLLYHPSCLSLVASASHPTAPAGVGEAEGEGKVWGVAQNNCQEGVAWPPCPSSGPISDPL